MNQAENEKLKVERLIQSSQYYPIFIVIIGSIKNFNYNQQSRSDMYNQESTKYKSDKSKFHGNNEKKRMSGNFKLANLE